MATRSTATAPFRPGGLDPLRWLWELLTNVKFALVLVSTAAGAALVGVVLPQVPLAVRSSPSARAAWLELQRGDFGRLVTPMDRLDLFDVFHSPWFNGLWALIIVSVTVCAVSRFAPTWRSVQRPPREVGERYFEVAHHRASFTHPGGAAAVETELRRRHFAVERVRGRDNDAVYVFAQKYAWSQYGTFASHLALLMLLVGGLLTRYAGFDETLIIAETAPSAPVFKDPGPGQLFVGVTDAYRGLDERGNIIDFHSDLQVRRSDGVVTCKATVNDPCRAFGYRIHQAAFFDDFARLRVTGPDGRVVFDDLLDFESRNTVVPLLRVTDSAGNILFDQALPQMDTDPGISAGPEDDEALAGLVFPAAPGSGQLVRYGVSWRSVDGRTLVRLGGAGVPRQLAPGESVATAGGYRIEYPDDTIIPAALILDLPGASGTGPVIIQMPVDRSGRPYLFVSGVGEENVAIVPGVPWQALSGYTYSFDGRVEASALNVRRDPGDTFIWIAVAMAVVGLAVTFYVPRRRLWVKVAPGRSYLAGIADKTTRFGREMRFIGAALGSRDALLAEDREEP